MTPDENWTRGKAGIRDVNPPTSQNNQCVVNESSGVSHTGLERSLLESSMTFKPLHWIALSAALVGAATLTPSSAKNAYRLQAIQQYSVTTMGCIYCHTSPSGGSNWNSFGTALKAVYFGTAKSNISEALYLVLKANKDSDGDGYSDTLEIVAKTLPGDKASKPTKTVKALEAELKALGGVDKFKKK